MSLFQQNEMSSRVTVGHQKSRLIFYWVAQVVKNLPAMWEPALSSIPGSERSPGEGNGKPFQYSCLENHMDGGAWWATVHRITKNWTRLSDFTFTFLWNCMILFSFYQMKAHVPDAEWGQTNQNIRVRSRKGLLTGQARRPVAQGLVEVNLSTILDLFGFNQSTCPWAMPFF